MNFSFSRKTDLALRLMRRLGSPGVKIAGAEMAASIGTTTSFLPQVAAPLIEQGWVTSERGPNGGYSLAPSALDVSLLDVVEATAGPTIDGRCVLRDQPCPGSEECPAHIAWTDARAVLIEGFRQISAV